MKRGAQRLRRKTIRNPPVSRLVVSVGQSWLQQTQLCSAELLDAGFNPHELRFNSDRNAGQNPNLFFFHCICEARKHFNAMFYMNWSLQFYSSSAGLTRAFCPSVILPHGSIDRHHMELLLQLSMKPNPFCPLMIPVMLIQTKRPHVAMQKLDYQLS